MQKKSQNPNQNIDASAGSDDVKVQPTQNRSEVLQLFLSFFKIGLFTFGGGWAMISIIEREIVDKYNWIRREDFLDLLAVAQSLPGILAVNIATAVGDKLHGMKGSAVATLGCVLPSFLIILCIAIFLTPDMIKSNHLLSAIFMGIRPAVVALIIAPVITSARAAKLGLKTVWIPLVVALMISSSQLFGINLGFASNPILFIILGGLGGWLFWRMSIKNLKNHNNQTES
ncbi:MAG: chromate transporter [Muribaculaceae bacterium]|nr:chromate transporter [Muribaculaceae bacterium]